jgi:hypothetical protein
MRELAWKRGVDSPPFVESNTAVMALLEQHLCGGEGSLPHIRLSLGVAMQLYLLFFDKEYVHAGVARRGMHVRDCMLLCMAESVPPLDSKHASIMQTCT